MPRAQVRASRVRCLPGGVVEGVPRCAGAGGGSGEGGAGFVSEECGEGDAFAVSEYGAGAAAEEEGVSIAGVVSVERIE